MLNEAMIILVITIESDDIEGITAEREREITPPIQRRRNSRIAPNSLTVQRKPEQREKLRHKNRATARQK